MAEKWIRRLGSKVSGFRYSAPDGSPVRDKSVRERIDLLRIPPAWRDVHIAANPRAAIQVWGFDARGRKQYRYHARAVEKGELRKFYRVTQMGREIRRLKTRFLKDFSRNDQSLDHICAGLVLLISQSFLRIGSERHLKENNTFGITTLRKSHVTVLGEQVEFRYLGKRSIRNRQVVVDASLARFVESLMRTPGTRLFRYKNEGKWKNVDARDVNDYIEKVAGFPYTAKDFRTWGGSLRAATILEELGPVNGENARKKIVAQTVRMVASELGNTPAICRKSYVHPILLTRYMRSGSTIVLPKSARSRRLPSRGDPTLEERALIDFLDEHFPERRSERRTPGSD